MSRNENALHEATDKKPGKLFIIISYVIALASLIAMLFVPLFDGKMFIQCVLSAVAPILDKFGVSVASLNTGFFINELYDLHEGIMLTLIYLSVILALIMFIPVIAGKAAKGTNLRCAFAAELLAFIFILACVAYEVLALNSTTWHDFSLIIPLGVIMLVMAAQSIKYKGGNGVAKFIIFLLSLVTLFTLFDIVAYIPVLEQPLTDLSGILGAYTGDVTFIGDVNSAIIPFAILCNGVFNFAGLDNIPVLISQIVELALPILLMLSILLDIISISAGNKTKKNGEPNPQKGWFVFAAIRYSLIIVLIGASVALSFLLEGFIKVGIYMYLTAVVTLLTFIVEIVRYCVGKGKVKAYRKEQELLFKNETIVIRDDTLAQEPAEEAVAEPVETENVQTNMFGDQPVAEEVVPVLPAQEIVAEPVESLDEQISIMDAQPVDDLFATEQVAPQPIEEVVVQTKVEPQIGSSFSLFNEVISADERTAIDPFIDKLTDVERAQFYDIFINRNKGKFSSIPVYTLNGNNADFFPAVFVHINRMRNLCCDSLLLKIYKEIGNN